MDGRLELVSGSEGTRFTLVLHAERIEAPKTVKTAQPVS